MHLNGVTSQGPGGVYVTDPYLFRDGDQKRKNMWWDGSLACAIDIMHKRLLSDAEKERKKTETEDDG